jgi:putative phage-type endonuclease
MNTDERREWLNTRRKYIGSSDITKLLGAAPKSWGGPYAVWKSKMFEVTDDDSVQMFYWGRRLEPIIAEEYGRQMGMAIDFFPEHYVTPWPASGFDHVACTPDYFASDPETADSARHPSERVLVECKNVGAWNERDWGVSGSDADGNVPEYYVMQVRWQMGCTGATNAVICALIGGSDWRYYNVTPDPGWFYRTAAFADDWYRRHVVDDYAPIPDERNEVLLGSPPEVGHVMVADDDLEQIILQRALNHHLVNEHTRMRKQLDAQLVTAMGDTYDGIRLRNDDSPAVTHKPMPSNPAKRRYSFLKQAEQE